MARATDDVRAFRSRYPDQAIAPAERLRDEATFRDSEPAFGPCAPHAGSSSTPSRKAANRLIVFGLSRGHYASWVFLPALGELRGVFGIHLARIAALHGLDVEEPLSSILPAAPEKEGGA
jgi:hypothetical protein